MREEIWPGRGNVSTWTLDLADKETAFIITKVAIRVGDEYADSETDFVEFDDGTDREILVTAQLGLAFAGMSPGQRAGQLIVFTDGYPDGWVWFDDISFIVHR